MTSWDQESAKASQPGPVRSEAQPGQGHARKELCPDHTRQDQGQAQQSPTDPTLANHKNVLNTQDQSEYDMPMAPSVIINLGHRQGQTWAKPGSVRSSLVADI